MLITFPDSQLATVTVLRSLLADRVEPYVEGVTVGTRVPYTTSDDVPSLPLVVVRLEGSTNDRRVSESAALRVIAWAESEHAAHALARLAHSLLVAYEGGDEVRGFRPRTGPTPSLDPDSGTPLSAFTVTAIVRPDSL